tara:strand:+ start:1672 stop:2631 length:960 start_codon:yes stop_codon:yes gene_type:complete
MVDIEKLTSIANTGKYPNLCSLTDVEAVKSIMEIYPDLFSSTYSQGVHINRSESKTTEYGFRFQIPTGITQYQYFDGHIGESVLFQSLLQWKSCYFVNDIMTHEVLYFEDPPLFAPTIDALCNLAAETTGNTDTSSLKGLLELFNADIENYAIHTADISRLNKTIRIALFKTDRNLSEDVLKYMGTRSNTKTYINIKGLSDCVEVLADDQDNNLIEIVVEFNESGLVKNIGYALGTHYKKDAPEGTTPYDNLTAYNERRTSHETSVSNIASSASAFTWFPETWIDEISTWETIDTAVHGATIVTASSEGTKSELIYGLT